MGLEKINFKNYPDTSTPLNAENLNQMQDNMDEALSDFIDNSGGYPVPIGAIFPYAGMFAPEGYLLCDGSAVSRTEYAELFNVLGDNFGIGDRYTTFNVPNLKGRVPIGRDPDDDDLWILGSNGGEKEHTLTVDEMPSHNHGIGVLTRIGAEGGNKNFVGGSDRTYTSTDIIDAEGGGQPHNNLPPYVILNYIIKAK